MVYEDICNFGMDQLVITQYKKILKILQENSNILILKIPIEKVKSKEEDDLDEMMEKIIDDIIRSQIEIIEKEHKKTGFKIVSIFEMVTYDPEEGLTIQITKTVKPYLKNLI